MNNILLMMIPKIIPPKNIIQPRTKRVVPQDGRNYYKNKYETDFQEVIS